MTRFWAKVDKSAGPDACWLWTGSKTSAGYGNFRLNGGNVYAHRYVMGNPEGAHVLHRCDNPGCVNPAHLFLGSNADNIADRVAKGRSRPGFRLNPPPRKLDAAQAYEVRTLVSLGWGLREVARAYGVSHATVSNYVRGVHASH